MPIPKRWQGCKHVVECIACNGKGYHKGWWNSPCALCEKRGVLWNGLTIPENMILRGYSVFAGQCWYTPNNSVYGGFTLTEAQICANIWELDGPVVPWKPAPLHLLDNARIGP